MTGRGWIQTFSGGAFWPTAPKAEDVRIEDIAHGLSNVCRYNGHTLFHYSVAQHATLVAGEAARRARAIGADEHLARLIGLHHDDAEAYLCDVPSPIKRSVMIDGLTFAQVEENVQLVIARALGLPWPVPQLIADIVRAADGAVFAAEVPIVMAPAERAWLTMPAAADVPIVPMAPGQAERSFLTMHQVALSRMAA